ncbi:MAG: 3-keto-5-aminohexanoate cleavage protein [Dehalococcoidia bacterium]|nr:MAG: 3-keto-5-aminohexanoate cleavage protein [Dehalococcoidia bacterium]
MDKFIVTAAITGSIHTPTMSPYLPITPRQIADEAVRAYEAGAAVAHIHVRNPETGQPVPDIELFREVITDIKSRCNMVLCLTTGGGAGMTVEERGRVVPTFKPELASLNFGSLNFALFPVVDMFEEFKYPWEKFYLEWSEDYIFPNTFKTLREFSQLFAENDTKPELEIYDLGMVNNVAFMLQQQKENLKQPVYLQFVLGILGGAPPTPETLMFLHNTARAMIGDFVWSVCAAGRHQLPLCTMALIMGGNVRVGMEDSLYAGKGVMATSNADQVEKIVAIGRQLSREPATPDEARQILGLKGLDKVNW